MASLESKNTKLKTEKPNRKLQYQRKKKPKPIPKNKLPNRPTLITGTTTLGQREYESDGNEEVTLHFLDLQN